MGKEKSRGGRDNQKPTFGSFPDVVSDEGQKASMLASAFFGEPIPWQQLVLDVMCDRYDDGNYISRTIANFVSRQNGKSWSIRARVVYGLIVYGERILYTCHNGDTANTMFEEICSIFEDDDNPELKNLVDHIYHANGKEAIYLKNGGKLLVRTRNAKLSRGQTFDVIIYDECQCMDGTQQSASLPTINTSPNPQVIYAGTPPGPEDDGSVAYGIRDGAMSGTSKTALLEWSVPDVGDRNDKSRWWASNPSMGYLIHESTIETAAENKGISDEDFAREYLGWWAPRPVSCELAIDAGAWKATGVKSIGDVKGVKQALGLKFSPDGSRYALAGAVMDKSGCIYAELVESGNTGGGTKALAATVAKMATSCACCYVDGQNAADSFCGNAEDAKAPRNYVIRAKTSHVIAAAGMLVDALDGKRIFHASNANQAELDESARVATKRQIGRSGWGFGGSSTAIEALAMAAFGVKTCRRNPNRRQEIL